MLEGRRTRWSGCPSEFPGQGGWHVLAAGAPAASILALQEGAFLSWEQQVVQRQFRKLLELELAAFLRQACAATLIQADWKFAGGDPHRANFNDFLLQIEDNGQPGDLHPHRTLSFKNHNVKRMGGATTDFRVSWSVGERLVVFKRLLHGVADRVP
ncbi:hypothetical protein SBA3_3920003 [Candidatus Sulfopaludibacter sp. SbA3]|nr:hypothetical protein SBA3_3920003 [Candidatus Sulfopaludibacter sp. SbA3]